MNVSQAIRTKRAERVFQDKLIPEEAIRAILHAGLWAQSAKNMQPWHFIAIQDKETLNALSKLGRLAGHLSGDALGVAIITPHPSQRYSVMLDARQAAAYMQLIAWEMGIASCLATIYETDEARELFGFHEDLHIRIALSFGYPLPSEEPPRPPRKEGRRRLDEVMHWEIW